MKKTMFVVGGLVYCLVFALAGAPAKADSVDFSNQTGPSTFAAASGPQTITEGLATFTGGVILTNESGTLNNFSVYATCNPGTCGQSSSLLNPLTITFSAPVSNVTLIATNALGATYTFTDNLGNAALITLGVLTVPAPLVDFSLVDSGITSATFGSSASGWDFAIEGLTYTPAAVVTPEPSALLLLVTGLLALAFFARRKSPRMVMC
jgi:PEP-CTERM motif